MLFSLAFGGDKFGNFFSLLYSQPCTTRLRRLEFFLRLLCTAVSDQPRVGSSSGGFLGADQTRRYSIPINGQRCISEPEKGVAKKDHVIVRRVIGMLLTIGVS